MKSSEFRLEELLALVGSSPLESATSEVLALAEAVWYQGYRPTQADLDSLARSVEPQSFKRTLCVLELLSQYPVCPRSTAKELQKLTQDFHAKYSSPGSSEALKGRYSPSMKQLVLLDNPFCPFKPALMRSLRVVYMDFLLSRSKRI